MKKHLALLLALVMVLGSFSFVSAAPDFEDVKDTTFEEAVSSLELLEILKGYPDGTFKPANTITRAEFAAVAVRVSGLEQAAVSAKGLPTGFTDVPAYHWASGYVGTAGKLGIVNGIGGGLFAPESPVKYEEAITMLVRALGYEPAAQAKGGYPFGYLIVANEIDLLEDAMGTQGTWATRGFVAQITFNALEIEMMIQSGYGSETRFVVSGTDGTKEKYLIEQMGFKSVEGRVNEYDLDDLEIAMTITEENGVELKESKEKTYDVVEGFDFYRVHGVTVKAWLDGSKVVLTKLVDKVMFDATEFKADNDEITLVYADKDYKLDKDVRDFYFNDSLKDFRDDNFNADYAKVVMDGSKVVWADGVNFTEFVVVKEVNKTDLVDFEDDEYDVKDYLIVKDGKTIALSALEAGDVVFLYNDDYFDYDGLGVVATNEVEGVVEKAYTRSFKLDKDTYDLVSIDVQYGPAQYLDDKDQDDVDEDVLSAFEDEGKKIKVVLDFYGDAVLLDGTRGVAATSTYGAILTAKAEVYTGRGNVSYINWDFINELGEKVKFDEEATTLGGVRSAKWDVVEYVVEDDGDLDEVTNGNLAKNSSTTKVEIKDRFEAKGSRLENSTVVFLMEEARGHVDQDVDEVFKWEKAKDYFGEITDYDVYSKDGKAKYLVVYASDAGGDYSWEAGVITKVRQLAGTSNDYDLTISIDGTKKVLTAKDAGVKKVGEIVEFEIDDDMTEVKKLRIATGIKTLDITDADVNTRDREIAGYKVVNSTVIFNKALDVKTINDLYDLAKDGITVRIYMDGNVKTGVYSDTFIKYVVVGAGTVTPAVDLTAYNAALAAVTEAGYTEASWTAYQAVVAANVVTTANTQAEVNAATAAIVAAQDDLVVDTTAISATYVEESALGVAKVTITVVNADAVDVEKVLVNGAEVVIKKAENKEVTILSAAVVTKVEIVIDGTTYTATK